MYDKLIKLLSNFYRLKTKDGFHSPPFPCVHEYITISFGSLDYLPSMMDIKGDEK